MSFRRSVLGSGTLDTLISSSKVAVSIPILLTVIRTSWNGQAKGSVNSRNLYTSNIRNGRSRNGLTQSCTTTTGDVLGTFIGQNVRRSDHLTSRTKYDNASIAAQPSLQAQVALIERAMDAETSSLYATRLSRDAYTYGKYNKNPTTRDAVKYGYTPLPPIIHRQQIFRHEIHSKMPVLLEESTFKEVSLATLAAFFRLFRRVEVSLMTLEPLHGKDVECNPCSNTQRSTNERRLPSQARSSSYQRANLNSDMEKILFFALCSIEDCLEAISDKKRHLSISDMKDSSHLMLASTTEDNVSTSIVSIEDSSTLTPSSGNTDSVSHSSRELRHMDDIWESLQMCASESPLVVCLLVAAGKYNVPKEERLFPGGIEEQLTLFPILSSGARVAEGLA